MAGNETGTEGDCLGGWECWVLGATSLFFRQAQGRLSVDAGTTGRCSVGWGNVFSFWANVSSFRPDVFTSRRNVFSLAGEAFSKEGAKSGARALGMRGWTGWQGAPGLVGAAGFRPRTPGWRRVAG